MIQSFHEIGLCIRIGIGLLFFGVQSVACSCAREFDCKAPPSEDFSTLMIFAATLLLTKARLSLGQQV
jgi:hypothetical protein